MRRKCIIDTRDYLSGLCSAAIVPDLVLLLPGAEPLKLVFIFESPHVDELADGIPVAGRAGRSVLSHLRAADVTEESLGSFVKERHNAGDSRIAILNVSTVPLQEGAFTHSAPPCLAAEDWSLLNKVRESRARYVPARRQDVETSRVDDILLRGLQARFKALKMSADCVVVTCGLFAQRFGRALGGLHGDKTREVPHPSRNLWNRASGEKVAQLDFVKQWFASNT